MKILQEEGLIKEKTQISANMRCIMLVLSYVFISITALLHIAFFKLESLDFMKPEVMARFGLSLQKAEAARVWAYNQGFYNLFLALGIFYGLYLLKKGKKETAGTLLNVILLVIVGAGIVLFFSAPGMERAAFIQAMPALLGLIFLNRALVRL